jgi:hypothetical protein
VFTSTGSPTGYDNHDAASGQPDTEVYLYNARAAGGTGKLVCISCNPSGARPLGVEGEDPASRVSGRIPGAENNLHEPRIITDEGNRVFFESYDALSPRDVNGVQDVYEWEANGAGGCTTGANSYVPAAEGCIYLISSGQGGRDTEFVEADQDGANVFFATLSSLVPQDYGLIDIYDARVDGGFPTPPAPSPECDGEACQPSVTPPSAAGPSTTQAGPGNVKHESKPCPGKKNAKKGCTKKRHKKGKPHKKGKHPEHKSKTQHGRKAY